jgi:hypothetical protein
MLFTPKLPQHLFTYQNGGANPGTALGTSVTPGASDAEGSATIIATGSNIAQDIYGFMIRVSDGATATQSKSHLLDIGVDNAGGTSYTWIISNLVCGDSGSITATGAGHAFFFPMFIKAGSQVAAGTVLIGAKFYGYNSAQETMPVGMFSETIGTITGSSGVTVTPGNAADGSWTSLGTTTNALWWWQMGYQIDNAAITAEYTFMELAYGDATNKIPIMKEMHGGTTGETVGTIFKSNLSFFECYCPVPAGTNIYARMRCNNAPDTAYNMVAVGVGG